MGADGIKVELVQMEPQSGPVDARALEKAERLAVLAGELFPAIR
jgi:hypothetical protein